MSTRHQRRTSRKAWANANPNRRRSSRGRRPRGRRSRLRGALQLAGAAVIAVFLIRWMFSDPWHRR
jgi:Flp pilus assembly protein TadB